MRNVVNVGQRAGDEDVALASLWEDGLLGLLHEICTCGQRELEEASDRLKESVAQRSLYAHEGDKRPFVRISRSSRLGRPMSRAAEHGGAYQLHGGVGSQG